MGVRRGGTVAGGVRAWVGGNAEIPDGDAEGVTVGTDFDQMKDTRFLQHRSQSKSRSCHIHEAPFPFMGCRNHLPYQAGSTRMGRVRKDITTGSNVPQPSSISITPRLYPPPPPPALFFFFSSSSSIRSLRVYCAPGRNSQLVT